MNDDIRKRLQSLRLLVCDVDGTLTDGGITYTKNSEIGVIESKTFDVRDGLGIVMAELMGIGCAWITGRSSRIVQKRAEELGVRTLIQNARDKDRALRDVSAALRVPLDAMAYIGDDWNDWPAMRLASVKFAPADAAPEIRLRADIVVASAGGRGAVRDAIATILEAQGRLEEAFETYQKSLAPKQPFVEQEGFGDLSDEAR